MRNSVFLVKKSNMQGMFFFNINFKIHQQNSVLHYFNIKNLDISLEGAKSFLNIYFILINAL